MIAIFNSKCHQQPKFPFFDHARFIHVYSNCLKNKDSPVTGIEPGEDVSIKPVRGKFTKNHVPTQILNMMLKDCQVQIINDILPTVPTYPWI